MSLIKASEVSPEDLIQIVGQSILSAAENLRARAHGEIPDDAPLEPFVSPAIVPIPYEEALDAFNRSCSTAGPSLEEAVKQLKGVLNHSLSLQLAASMNVCTEREMRDFDQDLDRRTNEWVDLISELVIQIPRIVSTLGLYSKPLGYFIDEDGEETSLHNMYATLITLERFVREHNERLRGEGDS